MADWWAKEKKAIWSRQTPAFVDYIEGYSFHVEADLCKFDDGTWYISLDIPEEVWVTPAWTLKGTYWETVPVHVTLGIPPPGVEFQAERARVRGVQEFQLAKWVPRRDSTTYLPRGGLAKVCARFSYLGFVPRGEWHISL